MTYEPRWYQREAIEAPFLYWAKAPAGASPCIEVPTGGGKSAIIGWTARRLVEEYGCRVVVATHRSELIEQDAADMREVWPNAPIGIYSAGLNRREAHTDVVICGVQSMARNAKKLGHRDVMIVDECFPGDTMVKTPRGDVRIDSLRCGDLVFSLSGISMVEAVSVKPVRNTLEVVLDDGKKFRCTGNHPILTDQGWKMARELEVGSVAVCSEDMPSLWGLLPAMEEREGCSAGKGMGKTELLLSIVCEEMSTDRLERTSQKENEGAIEGDQASPNQAWRQRAIAAFGSSGAFARSWGWMGGGSRNQNGSRPQKWRIPELLQGRHREQGEEDRRGAGWSISQWRSKRDRHKKDGKAFGARVVSVSRVERESFEPVFNIQVSGHPSYFANGVAVHNCHMVNTDDGTLYRRLIDTLREENPDMRLLGYTATPFRLGQGYVTSGDGALFDSIPYRVDVKRLIAEGFLSPIVTGYATANIDVTEVATRAGEFVARDLELAANVDEVNEHVAEDVAAALKTRKLALVYGVSVAHAAMLRNALQMRGVSCEMITGDMDRPQRREIIKAFKSGQIRCITSCDVLTTGFNVPAVDVIAIVRPTQSTALYVQIVGRGMRTAEGKTDCLLLDYGANIARHGPIDSVRVREASARKGEGDAPVKSCPSCFAEVPTASRVCPHCDFEFPPPERKANAKASSLPALSVKIPQKRTTHDVGSIGVWRHQKKSGDGPPTVRIDYFEPTDSDNVGGKIASEWLCFDHDQTGLAYRKAVDWWVSNVGTALPKDVDDAVARLRTKELPKVLRIVVEPDGEFTRVVKVIQEAPREPGADEDEPVEPIAPAVGFDDDELPF